MNQVLQQINYGSQMTDKYTIYNGASHNYSKNQSSNKSSTSNSKVLPISFYKQQQNILKCKDLSIQSIIAWIQKFLSLPHCQSVHNINDLKNGIALAQVLSTILQNPQIKIQLLSQIYISNINSQTSIQNLKTILKILSLSGFKKSNYYCPEDLFLQKNKSNKFQYFLKDFYIFYMQSANSSQNQNKNNVYSLPHSKETATYYSIDNRQNYPPGLQQLSQIANLSSNNILFSQGKQNKYNQIHNLNLLKYPYSSFKKLPKREQVQIQEDQQQNQVPKTYVFSHDQISSQKKQQLMQWAFYQMKSTQQIEQPHQFLAILINDLFLDRFHSQPIIKKCHFQMGSLIVWKKINNFLSGVERLRKHNLIELIKGIEQEQIVKESVFWKVIQDLKQMKSGKTISRNSLSKSKQNHSKQNKRKQNHSIKTLGSKIKSSKNIINQKTQHQQNIIINKKSDIKQIKPKLPQVSKQNIQEAEKWIQQLGFMHTLNQSKKKKQQKKSLKNALQSPLLNGNLIGSLLMRLQIGKPILIKQPINAKQLEKNLQQILRISLGRGYVCVRNLLVSKGNYNQYMGVVYQIKILYEQQKQKSKKKNQVHYIQKKNIFNKTFQDHNIDSKQLINWLQKNFDMKFQNSQALFANEISCQQLSLICSQLLKIGLYRETTLKIQLQNMQKILEELRRIGLSQYFYEKADDYVKAQQGNCKRWKIISEIFTLFGSLF